MGETGDEEMWRGQVPMGWGRRKLLGAGLLAASALLGAGLARGFSMSRDMAPGVSRASAVNAAHTAVRTSIQAEHPQWSRVDFLGGEDVGHSAAGPVVELDVSGRLRLTSATASHTFDYVCALKYESSTRTFTPVWARLAGGDLPLAATADE